MYVITFWEDPKIKHDPSDYDEIETIRINSINEIRTLFFNKPKKCTFITLERTSETMRRDGSKTNKYRVRPLWEKNNPQVTEYQKYLKNVGV